MRIGHFKKTFSAVFEKGAFGWTKAACSILSDITPASLLSRRLMDVTI
jgi:hypothetical protein